MTDTATVPDVLWRIDWRGRSWNSNELTGQHAAVIAELLDTPPSWEWMHPALMHPGYGPLQTMSLIAAFVVIDDEVVGKSARAAVLKAVQEATADELLAAVTIED